MAENENNIAKTSYKLQFSNRMGIRGLIDMFLFLWIVFVIDVQAAGIPDTGRCQETLRTVSIFEVQKIFSNKENYIKYQGQKGYLLFASQIRNSSKMDYIFNIVSKALGKRFNGLGWQLYQGSPEELNKEWERILRPAGSLKEEYKGMGGYAEYAAKYYDGNMKKAFINVSAVLDASLFNELGWRYYYGSLEELNKERGRILRPAGSLKEEYKGMGGCAKYAAKYYNGNMQKAFINVSAVLGGYWGMKKIGLNWKRFQGSASEYHKLLELFQNNKAMDFEGIEGQIEVAKQIFNGHYKKTYENVSALREVLFGNRKAFTKLNWSKHLK